MPSPLSLIKGQRQASYALTLAGDAAELQQRLEQAKNHLLAMIDQLEDPFLCLMIAEEVKSAAKKVVKQVTGLMPKKPSPASVRVSQGLDVVGIASGSLTADYYRAVINYGTVLPIGPLIGRFFGSVIRR